MLVALTEDGNRIYADEAQKKDQYGISAIKMETQFAYSEKAKEESQSFTKL